MSRSGRVTGLVAVVAALALVAGCGGGTEQNGEQPGTIALLLPESKTSRYESLDRPHFERTVAELCPECELVYANADQSTERQQAQAESALAQGAEVLVLGAVDAVAARGIVEAAAERGVAVIAYDRFISDAPVDFFVSYDSGRVGQLQGQALVDAIDGDIELGDGILLVHGAATDPNAGALKQGLSEVLFGSGIEVFAEYDTPDWSPDKAQEWVESQLTLYGHHVIGVYAANDGTASGAISAMRAAGMDPVPPVTGQDADLSAIQRIVAGDQHMTVYKRIGQQARLAATLAVDLVNGEDPDAHLHLEGVPSVLLIPVAVTQENLQRVVIDGGLYTTEQICTVPYRRACRELGLLEEDA